MNAQRYLHVTDIEEILSWTPHEYRLLLKGAQHRQIDEYELMARQAMATGYAMNSKKPNQKRIFDAEKARRKLETGNEMSDQDIERIKRMNKALKGFTPQFIPKKKVNR